MRQVTGGELFYSYPPTHQPGSRVWGPSQDSKTMKSSTDMGIFDLHVMCLSECTLVPTIVEVGTGPLEAYFPL